MSLRFTMDSKRHCFALLSFTENSRPRDIFKPKKEREREKERRWTLFKTIHAKTAAAARGTVCVYSFTISTAQSSLSRSSRKKIEKKKKKKERNDDGRSWKWWERNSVDVLLYSRHTAPIHSVLYRHRVLHATTRSSYCDVSIFYYYWEREDLSMGTIFTFSFFFFC